MRRHGSRWRHSPPLYAILLGLKAQLDRLLTLPVYNTQDGVVFYFSYKVRRASVLLLLHSPFLSVTEGEPQLVNRITDDVWSAMRTSPKILECVKVYNNRIGLSCKSDLVIIKVTAGGKDDKEYKWALHWKPATSSPNGKRLYLNAARQLVIHSIHAGGLINVSGGRIVWCQICKGTNHTSRFCPFPKITGWRGPPTKTGRRQGARRLATGVGAATERKVAGGGAAAGEAAGSKHAPLYPLFLS